ncbi:MAG: hypothetical protein M1814_005953 [Vezdaea aestivalis]|nr:MAG: hypothetical protein M1814_005953 [Vezdaea aestivalis]
MADANPPSILPLPDFSPSEQQPMMLDTEAKPQPNDRQSKMDDGSSSELSDLDEDVIIGDIEPDHYYEGGKIPVFKPTMDQFRNFSKFVDKIDKYGMKSGIVKIVPPDEWKKSLPELKEAVKTIKVKNPIRQEFNGNQGIYRQLNMEQPRSYNLPEWRQLSEAPHHQPPARRGERRRNQERMSRTGPRPLPKNSPVKKPAGAAKAGPKRRGRPRKVVKEEEANEGETMHSPALSEAKLAVGEAPPTPTSPQDLPIDGALENITVDNMAVVTAVKEEEHDDIEAGTPTKAKGRQPKSVSSRRKHNRRVAADIIDEAAFKDFDYRINDQLDYTPERCEELERSYWKGLTYSSPLYGADMPGSLFSENTNEWNVAKLDNLLNVLGQKVPGVNTAYLYLGMWKSTFAWHLEDVDLYSINYIHFGAPKQWYSISQEDARKFEAAMRNEFPEDAKKCGQFLRHKSFLISPSHLKAQYGIEVNRLVHHEGEFVITFPYGYHSGYNIGYNCAESVNFATTSWLEYGKLAKKCECESDSVWVDVWDVERKLRGEETEFEETDEEMDDDERLLATDIPTPPESIEGKSHRRSRKRKAENGDEPGTRLKRIRVRVKDPKEEVCVLCPNDFAHEPLLPTEDGKRAHAICALYVPETYISGDKPNEIVYGVSSIDKARMGLKCHYCRSIRGACFQCCSKKCVRAYHATCAAPGGVLVDRHNIPIYLDDGKEYKDIGVDYRCRFHRTKRLRTMEGSALEANKSLMKQAHRVAIKDVVQMQFFRGDIFSGVVVENRQDEQTLLIDVLPSGGLMEVEYKWLLILDPADSKMHYASENALPLPPDQLRNALLLQNDDPQTYDPFGEANSGYIWAEFQSGKPTRNPTQVKVDVNAPGRLWHYVGEISTETKARYTADPSSRVHDRRSVFLDTVKPRPVPVARRSATGPLLNGSPHMKALAPGPDLSRSEKPYAYKPKHPVLTSLISPLPPHLQRYQPAARLGGNPLHHIAPNLNHQHHTMSQYSMNGKAPVANMAGMVHQPNFGSAPASYFDHQRTFQAPPNYRSVSSPNEMNGIMHPQLQFGSDRAYYVDPRLQQFPHTANNFIHPDFRQHGTGMGLRIQDHLPIRPAPPRRLKYFDSQPLKLSVHQSPYVLSKGLTLQEMEFATLPEQRDRHESQRPPGIYATYENFYTAPQQAVADPNPETLQPESFEDRMQLLESSTEQMMTNPLHLATDFQPCKTWTQG